MSELSMRIPTVLAFNFLVFPLLDSRHEQTKLCTRCVPRRYLTGYLTLAHDDDPVGETEDLCQFT